MGSFWSIREEAFARVFGKNEEREKACLFVVRWSRVEAIGFYDRNALARRNIFFQGVAATYEDMIAGNEIAKDPRQVHVVRALQKLQERIVKSEAEGTGRKRKESGEKKPKEASFSLSGLFGWGAPSHAQAESTTKLDLALRRGMYVCGGPGSGKTFLMDMFYRTLPTPRKRRVHFHEFMLSTHARLHALQKSGVSGEAMMEQCVDEIAEESSVICFDEFQVTDVADAMIMQSLFTNLFQSGVVMVATSNRMPEELYKNGINRTVFLPFIDELNVACEVLRMEDGLDHREHASAASAASGEPETLYFASSAAGGFDALWSQVTAGADAKSAPLKIQGNRSLIVPLSGTHTSAARFHFDDLCAAALGAVDYYAIARAFPVVFIDGLRTLTLKDLNLVRRFITMVDAFYDKRVVLVLRSSVPIEALLDTDDDKVEEEVDVIGGDVMNRSKTAQTIDEVFAFDRTLSRLQEMQTPSYLKQVCGVGMEDIGKGLQSAAGDATKGNLARSLSFAARGKELSLPRKEEDVLIKPS